MVTSTSDLFFHPVRLRVIQELLGGVTQSTAEIAVAMPDVPTTSLYRQIGILIDAEVITITDERPVRGVVERTLALAPGVGSIDPRELAEMGPAQLRQSFAGFAAGLLAAFNRYTESGDPDLARDGVSYRQTALWLTDGELAELADEVGQAVARRAANGPGPGRAKRLMSQIVVPTPPTDTRD